MKLFKKNKSPKIETIDNNLKSTKFTNDEQFLSITQIFNGKNEWIGYEYEVIVNKNHVRISSHDDGGEILEIRHKFTDPLNTGTIKDFLSYMSEIKSISSNYNISYIRDSKKQPIDTTSTIDESKIFRDLQKK